MLHKDSPCVPEAGRSPLPHGPHPTVSIEHEGGDPCGSCPLRRALAFLLLHATGTGQLIMDRADLEEVGEYNLEQLTITVRFPQRSKATPP